MVRISPGFPTADLFQPTSLSVGIGSYRPVLTATRQHPYAHPHGRSGSASRSVQASSHHDDFAYHCLRMRFLSSTGAGGISAKFVFSADHPMRQRRRPLLSLSALRPFLFFSLESASFCFRELDECCIPRAPTPQITFALSDQLLRIRRYPPLHHIRRSFHRPIPKPRLASDLLRPLPLRTSANPQSQSLTDFEHRVSHHSLISLKASEMRASTFSPCARFVVMQYPWSSTSLTPR